MACDDLFMLCAQMTAMQQYSLSPLGYVPLQRWAAAHVAQQHSPLIPTSTCITTGSNSALEVHPVLSTLA